MHEIVLLFEWQIWNLKTDKYRVQSVNSDIFSIKLKIKQETYFTCDFKVNCLSAKYAETDWLENLCANNL